jgi:type IV pilus assembly protein PilW
MSHTRSHTSGFSLVELMVALTIGLLIILAVTSAFTSISSSKRTDSRVAQFQTNGRYAIDFMRREIRHAGFLAVTAAVTPQATSTVRLPIVQWTGSVSTTDYGCGAGFVTNLAQPIWGANDANGLSACIPSASYARGDVLVIRRAGLTAIPSTTALASNTLYVRSEFIGATVFLGPTRPVAQQSPVEDYPLQADVYYISNYTNSAAESPQVPALYRLTLGAGPALTPQLIASGIENMQVQYGVTTNAGTNFVSAGAVATADWANVTAMRIWLLARSTDTEPGYVNTSTYTMGDQTVTVNDSYQRQVFPLVVQLRR